MQIKAQGQVFPTQDVGPVDTDLTGRVYQLTPRDGEPFRVTVELWLTANPPMGVEKFFTEGAKHVIRLFLEDPGGSQESVVLRVLSGGLIRVLDPERQPRAPGALRTRAW